MCGRYFPTFSPSIFSPKGPRAFGCRQFLGDPSEEDPPVHIPNTVVKLLSPDGTARASVWESRTSPGLNQRPSLRRRPFVVLLTFFRRFHLPSLSSPCYIRIAFDKLPRIRPSVTVSFSACVPSPISPAFKLTGD